MAAMERELKKLKDAEQMTLTGGDDAILAQLTSRVEKAVKLIEELRRERDELRKRADQAEDELSTLRANAERVGELEEDQRRFEGEREEIRERIERILSTLESLDEASVTE